MGSNEPSLVPEWLRSNGHGSNGSNASDHFSSANSHSEIADTPLLATSARNRSSRTSTETGSPRLILEKSSSINSRRISNNNGSSKNPYSSFSRSNRDKVHEKEKSNHGDVRERDSSEPMVEPLRGTHSMMSWNRGDSLPRRVAPDLRKMETSTYFPRNGLVSGDEYVGSTPKVSFKDFPSLGADEKQPLNVARVVSPSLPIGSSAPNGEGWSALAEVPIVIGSNNGAQSINQPLSTSIASNGNSGGANAVSAALKPVSGTSNAYYEAQTTSSALGSSSASNMAEVLVQSPPVSPTSTQLSVDAQRLEQMAIKKVRQLIPVTPAMPKVNSFNKSKPKVNGRVGEISRVTKAWQKLSSSRSGHVTNDASNQSHGSKLFVLKPPWENHTSSTSKDVSNLENGAGIQQTVTSNAPAVSSGPVKSTTISKASSVKRREAISSLTLMSAVEKRPLYSSAQSRSDFFNSVRKKTSMTSAVSSETNNSKGLPSEKKSYELLNKIVPSSTRGTEIGISVNICDVQKALFSEEKSSTPSTKGDVPDEKEAVFLRSLGWEENGEEEELTEEEINEFNQLVEKLNPSLCISPGVQPASLMLRNHHASNDGESCTRLSSPDAAPGSC